MKEKNKFTVVANCEYTETDCINFLQSSVTYHQLLVPLYVPAKEYGIEGRNLTRPALPYACFADESPFE